ncbi:S9 family peptidase [Massilia glaciei]|uniref:S9 family peptidase n=1 Tax=Massilia glaciei TaxID=1524097 RepID=A0A2U2HFC0_9BURK|nr:S9 family peptidase [Massilia glaciei]PWF42875.1 S9 family peptidase [Massilia glaciei]
MASASGQARQLTAGTQDSAPRWSPDGNHLAFLRQGEKDGKPTPPQLWLMALAGGAPRQLTHLAKGAGNPVWSPDGKSIAFLSTTNEADTALSACLAREGADQKTCSPIRQSDVQVITRAVYRANGAGYIDFRRPAHLWRVDVAPDAAAAPRQLTFGQHEAREIAWAPDGKRIYFVADRSIPTAHFKPSVHTIYAVPAAGGVAGEVMRFAGRINGLAISPSGDRLAFIASTNAPVQSHSRSNLWVAALGGAPRNVTAGYDWDIGAGIISDQSAPRAGGPGAAPLWSADGRSVTVVVAKRGRANLERFDLHDGSISALTTGDQAVLRYSSNGRQTVALISTPTELNELYLLGADAAAPRRLTGVNRELFAGLNLSRPRDICYRSFDGRKIHALVQTPPGFDPKRRYPLILNIHGGPHAAYGHTFFHEMQWMAAKGYVVLYPNPRGSTTYGEQFANVIHYRYPGDDYRDLMAGVDELVRLGWADSGRMGVTGGSGGGLLTNWVIGRTHRFKAAVSQRDIANWADWWYSADSSFYNWFRKPPFEDPADFRARSPITYVNKIKTPTMFILSDADSRTPPESGGDQMFRALNYRKIATAMVRFPGESHDLSRSGKPWHRVERLQHIVNWFDLYLLGKQTNEYDLVPPALPDLRAAPAD